MNVLDVGASCPYLAKCLIDLGCNAMAIEAAPGAPQYAAALSVPLLHCDFEEWTPPEELLGSFNLVTMIHVFEHIYKPADAFRKVRRLLTPDGALFIRMPDHRVRGIERDLTPGHYTIHPYIHTLTSILQLCAETGTFAVEEQWALEPGQRDLLLRPLP